MNTTQNKITSAFTPLKVQKTRLEGVLQITPPTVFRDHRGMYVETYNEAIYREAGITIAFIQDDISVSRHNVLRGIHGDQVTWKLVSCLQGEFQLIVVNWNPDSAQYKQWQSFDLSEEEPCQILIPPKFGNAHLVLSETSIFHYKQSSRYDRTGQFTIRWNDPELAIPWKSSNPILSQRDQGVE